MPPPARPQGRLPAEPQGAGVNWRQEYVLLRAAAVGLLIDWAEAYTGAVRAKTDSVRHQAVVADCIDTLREGPKRKWWPW